MITSDMSTLGRKAHWDVVYATKAEDEVSWYEPFPETSLELIARTGVPKHAAIIDIGGGLSRLADRLAANGYSDLTRLDISSEAIDRLATRQGPGSPIEGIVADVSTWRPERRYDVWHDRAVLHFLIEEADRAHYRNNLLAALRPGGQAVIATFAPSGPERCSGLAVRRYDGRELAEFLGGEFAELESFEFDHRMPGGGMQRFHVGRFRLLH